MMCANAVPTYIGAGKPNKTAHAAGTRGGFLDTRKKRPKSLSALTLKAIVKKTNLTKGVLSSPLGTLGYSRLWLFDSKWARNKQAELQAT